MASVGGAKSAKGMTKSQLESELSEKVGLSKADIKRVFEALEEIVAKEVKDGCPIVIPNLVKIYVHNKKASAARDGINPATKAPLRIPAKPARKVVKTKPVSNLKHML